MVTHRLHLAAAPLARAAYLLIASLVLSGCGGEISEPSTPIPSLEPLPDSANPPPDPGKVPATASVTMHWMRPSQNQDGTELVDLAGYRIYYSQAPWGWTNSLNVQNPATTSIEIQNLSTGTWYFAMTSYNSAGVESERTDYVSKML